MTAAAQIKVADVGDGWKNKVEAALQVIQTNDSVKYQLLQKYCTRIDYWTGSFATTENGTTILIPASEMRVGVVNDIAAVIVHESLHLHFQRSNLTYSKYEEEVYCYLYELEFLYCIPNVEPWLIHHARTQVIKFAK